MRNVLTALLVCSIGSVATAAMTVDVVENASPGAGLESYTIWFNGDVASDALAGFSGRIAGSLHQVWGFSFGSWFSTPYGDSSPPDAKDTRLLLNQGSLTSVAGYFPSEDATNMADQGGGIFYGDGSYLAATATTDMLFAITAAYQQTNTEFARVVIPVGQQAMLTGQAAAADEIQMLLLDVTIPEPATLALLGIGGLAFLRRKRR